ncbi:hypothetical protein [Streptomyces specialis]|uniref:hypothetical protein n=1 Tax=Streptomyces specialis TaxID=498367 RepID=UPI000AB0DE7A|nr:hypothetical protein [Streptomyces specialis]
MLRRHRATWRLAAGSAVAGLAVAAGAITLAGPWDAGRRTAEREAAAEAERHGAGTERMGVTVPGAAPVLTPLDAAAPRSSPAALEQELRFRWRRHAPPRTPSSPLRGRRQM